jgi:cation diffusion facilitator family transporter
MANEQCEKCGSRAMFISAGNNVALTTLKGVVGVLTGSRALLADAFHSGSDILCALLGIWGTNLGRKPATKQFPYGYGKVEFIVGIVVGLILFSVAIGILTSSLKVLFSSVPNQPPRSLAVWVALLSIYANFVVSHYTLCAARELNSPALKAISSDNRSDAYSSIPVVIAVVGSQLGFPQMDRLGAVFVGLLIGKISFSLITENYKGLMDVSVERDTIHRLRQIVLSVPGVKSISYLKARQLGQKIWVDLQIAVGSRKTLGEANKISQEVRTALIRNTGSIDNVQVSTKPI